MNFSRRLTASISALLLAVMTPACVATPIDAPVDAVQEAEVSEASDALSIKAQALQMAITTAVRTNPTVRSKFSQITTARIPLAPIVSVLDDRVQLLVSVQDLVNDATVKPVILQAAGGALTSNDLIALAPDAFEMVTLRTDFYESIQAHYENLGLQMAYDPDVIMNIGVSYQELFALGALDIAVADDIAIAMVVLTAAGLAWGAYTWWWDHQDDDGDGVLNKDDDYPYDGRKQSKDDFRYPPWLEGQYIYAPLASDGQWAIDVTGMLFTRFVPPNANAISPVHANTMIQNSPGPVVTFANGPQARLAFLP